MNKCQLAGVLEPLWIGGSKKITGVLRAFGAEAISSDELTREAVRGRRVIVAPSAGKRDPHVVAQRDAKRALHFGAVNAAIVLNPPYGSDIADYAEEANGHGSLERIVACARPFGEGAATQTPSTTGIKVAELLAADFPEIRAICPPWLFEGVTILAGGPKCGKTTLMRQFAEAVPTGGAVLDSACSLSEVCFISLEEGPRLFRRKLQQMQMNPVSTAFIDLHFEWAQGSTGCARLAEYLKAHHAVRLVVIDSLSRFRQPADRNATQFQADYDAVTGLSGVAKQFPGVCIVVIHHTRKVRSADAMDDISGTYGLTAAADAYLVLRKEGTGGTLHAGGRLWDREDSDFELSRANQRWHLQGVSDGLSSGERFTLKVVSEAGGVTPTQLAKTLDCTRQNAYQRLDALLAKGKLQKCNGVYTVTA